MTADYFKETYLSLKTEHTSGMCFSSSKCEFLRIINNKDIINFQYLIQNSQIKEVQQAKYLGVTLNNKLTWSDHIQIMLIQHMTLYAISSTLVQQMLRAHCT